MKRISEGKGEYRGCIRRWFVAQVRAETRKLRAEALRMGFDPDRIMDGLSAVPDPDDGGSSDDPGPTDTGYGRANPVVSDPD